MTLSQQFITQKANSKAVHRLSKKKGGNIAGKALKQIIITSYFMQKHYKYKLFKRFVRIYIFFINIGYLKLATFGGNERKLFIVQIN